MATPHQYRIVPENPGAHLYRVNLTIAEPDSTGQMIALPAWTPGSYKIRDYARNIVSIDATSEGRDLEIVKVDKSRWLLQVTEAPITVCCVIHAYDLSVRGAHLDTTHAYFNGACVFPLVVGQESVACVLHIAEPPEGIGNDWRVATSMRRKDAELYGFGSYQASDYEELIDHPVEIGSVVPTRLDTKAEAKMDRAKIDLYVMQSVETLGALRPESLDDDTKALLLACDNTL